MDVNASEEKELRVSIASNGDNTALAALGAAKKIRVTGGFLVAASNVDLVIKSGSTALTGATTLTAKTQFEVGQLTLNANKALVLNLSSAVAVVGVLKYVESEVL